MFPGLLPYLVIALVAAVDFLWVAVSNIAVDTNSFIAIIPTLTLTAALALAARRVGSHFSPLLPEESRDTGIRCFICISILLEGMLFMRITGLGLPLFNHLTMSLPFPYADGWLMKADQMLHLDWTGYFTFVARHPQLVVLFEAYYNFLGFALVAVFLGLLFYNRLVALEFFLANFVFIAMICLIAGMFFPAEGAVAHIIGNKAILKNFDTPPGIYHVPYLEALRSGKPLLLSLGSLPGLVTFPSFHTAAGIIIAWSCKRSPLFLPALIYATLMIASTPVIGGHYFIDLLAGMVVAVTILSLSERLPRYRGFSTRVFSPAAAYAPPDESSAPRRRQDLWIS